MNARVACRIYLLPHTAEGQRYLALLREVLAEHVAESGSLEVLDVSESPQSLQADNVQAIPTLIRLEPEPEIRLVGFEFDKKRLAEALGMK